MLRRTLVAALLLLGAAAQAETVAVIGTGNVGMALGTEFHELGHTIIYGSRSPLSLKTLDLIAKTGKGTTAALPHEAAVDADIVVLAVPGMVTRTVAEGLGDLGGKIVIDATNPLKRKDIGEVLQFEHGVVTSNGEIVQALHPEALVVKAFNTMSWQQMMDPEAADTPPVVPLAGDHDEANQKVAEFVRDMDLIPLDLGGMEHARWTERTVVIMLNNRFSDREKFDLIILPRE